MIRSFKDKETKIVFNRGRSRKLPPQIHKRSKQKLLLIDSATSIKDLKIPPGNRLERLGGDQKHKWSIRINRQWRICFEWHEENAYNVEIVDYH